MIPSPCFVLEREKLLSNLEILVHTAQAAEVDLLIALKAFSLPEGLEIIRPYVRGASTSSLLETRLAARYLRLPIHLYAPAYHPAEVPLLVPNIDHWVFNSLSQLERYRAFFSPSMEIGLRVNPYYGKAASPLYNPGVAGSRLGIPPGGLPDPLPAGVSGLHVHTLCEADSYALENLLQSMEAHFAPALRQVRWLNLGGGHLITAEFYDREHFVSTIKAFRSRFPNLEKIYIEPGAAFVWEAGYLEAQVLDIVESGGIQTAILDISFAAHLPDTLEMPYKPRIRHAIEPPNSRYPTYRMGGLTCMAGDYVGEYSFSQPLEIGQRIQFEDMMHYTLVKTTFFNGVSHPAVGILSESGAFVLVRKFDPDRPCRFG